MIRRDRPVYTCRECVNAYICHGCLICPVYGCEVNPGEKACVYRDKKVKR